MATALSPKSLDALNRQSPRQSIDGALKTAKVENVDMVHDNDNDNPDSDTVSRAPSSPFQSEVNSRWSPTSNARSSLERLKSAGKAFAIHQDAGDTATFTMDQRSMQGNKERSQEGEYTTSSHKPVQSPQVVEEGDEHDAPSFVSDDTCFTNFSAVPKLDMTLFAKLDHRSPTRQTVESSAAARSPSPTPRPSRSRDGDTTNLLLDFTQQFDAASAQKQRQKSASPNKAQPRLLTHLNNQRHPSPNKAAPHTPGPRKNLVSLLDFDLPPQPTPRSVPTITIREVESLKSQFLSEISSLKASLSGRDAEVESLKKAVVDAERRVGEAQEELREERSAREHAEEERNGWEKRGHDVEAVLGRVRDEFDGLERERDDLLDKLGESSQARDELELRLAEARTRAAAGNPDLGDGDGEDSSAVCEAIIARRVGEQLDEKMENLARELHSVYKKKHETKVATLKKTYEARADKKSAELAQQLAELSEQNELLRQQQSQQRDDAPEIPAQQSHTEAEIAQQIELDEHRAKLAGLLQELETLKADQAQLLEHLDAERAEKGELVAAVDEMLALQADVGARPAAGETAPARKVSGSGPGSTGRPASGLRGPGFGFGYAAGQARAGQAAAPGSAPATLPGSGPGGLGLGKSKMMTSIERMGGAGARLG